MLTLPSRVRSPVTRSTVTLKSPESASDLPFSGFESVPLEWMWVTVLIGTPASSEKVVVVRSMSNSPSTQNPGQGRYCGIGR